MIQSILRLPVVKTSTGLSRSTVYLRIAQGVFTRPVSLGGRAVGWPAHEVAAVNAARIAGKSETEIRALVTQLETARKLMHWSVNSECTIPRQMLMHLSRKYANTMRPSSALRNSQPVLQVKLP